MRGGDTQRFEAADSVLIDTHYHLDHQGGNKIFKPEASIISTG